MIDHTFTNGQELLAICHSEQIPISEAAILAELSREEMDRDGIMSEMRLDLEVMRESIRVGLEEQQISITGLMGEDADKLISRSSRSPSPASWARTLTSSWPSRTARSWAGR